MSNNIRAIMWRWGDAPEQARRYQEQIRMFEERLEDCRGLSAMTYDGQPKAPGVSDPTGSKAIKILELEELYSKTIYHTSVLMNKTCNLMVAVDKILEECSPLQRHIAYMRYRDKRPWVYISIKLNVSEAWARRQDERMCLYVTQEAENGHLL